MKKLLLLLTFLVTAVGSLCAATYNKVTDFSTLQAGDKIILLSDYVKTGSNPYFLYTPDPNTDKTNVPGKYLDQSSTAKTIGDSYELPADQTVSEFTIVASGNSEYPWIFQVTVNGADYYLACTSTSKANQMGYKTPAEKTSTCEFKISADGVITYNSDSSITRNELQYSISDGVKGTSTFNCYTTGSQKKPLIFKLEEDAPTVGDISVKLNGEDYDLNDVPTLYLGDTFTFSAENAGYMYISGEKTNYEELTVNDGVATWTPQTPGDYDESVYAMLSKENNNGYKEQELMFIMDPLGPVVGTASDSQVFHYDKEYIIKEGTSLTFSSVRADAITITDSDNNVVASSTTGNIIFTPTVGIYLYTVKAERNWGENTTYSKDLRFFLSVVDETFDFGPSIIIKNNGEIVNYIYEDPSDVDVSDVLTFYCKNADHILVGYTPGYGWNERVFDGESATLPMGTYKPDATWDFTVCAYNGNDRLHAKYELQRSFRLNIKDKKPLGEIIVKANGTPIEYTYDEFHQKLPYEVYPGTVFTFECENADNFMIFDYDENIVAEEYDVNGSFVINTLGEHSIQVWAGKTAYTGVRKDTSFNVTVVEKPEDMEYKLVKSTDEVTLGGHYIIATTTDYNKAISNENKEANRVATDVTISNGMIVNPSESVMTFTLEKDKNDWLIKTENYLNASGEVANPQVYLHAVAGDNKLYASNPTANNLTNRNASIEIDDSNNAIIKFVNCVKSDVTRQIFYNAVENTGNLFNCYVTTNNQPVQLYKLDLEAPIFDQIVEDNSKVSFMTPKGELHIYMTEYDSKGNIVAENAPKRAAAENWTNKVAGKNEVYTIDVPTTEGNYLKIQAKAVLNGYHSAEAVQLVDANGQILSGVDAVVANADVYAPVEYFNLQGMRVDGNQPGLYIRRQGSKVEKILVK